MTSALVGAKSRLCSKPLNERFAWLRQLTAQGAARRRVEATER
jgi:hypothetical protein